MGNKIKILCLCLLALLISGCKAEYNIDIKSDLSVNEEISFMEKNSTISTMAPKVEDYITQLITDTQSEDDRSANYYISKEIGTKESGSVANRIYDDFTSFKEENILLGEIFTSINVTTEEHMVSIECKSLSSHYQVFTETATSDSLLESFKIHITVPFEVIDSNADSSDRFTNTYTWNYDKMSLYKDVDLSFDTSKPFKADIIDEIKNSYEKGHLNNILFIIGIVSVGLVIVVLLLGKKIKNSKI
jgi:hypothetical protein